MMFQVGQRVRFIRDSTDGGRDFGAKGDTATIIILYSGSTHVIIQLDKKNRYGFAPSAYTADLAPLTTPEDTFEEDGIE